MIPLSQMAFRKTPSPWRHCIPVGGKHKNLGNLFWSKPRVYSGDRTRINPLAQGILPWGSIFISDGLGQARVTLSAMLSSGIEAKNG